MPNDLKRKYYTLQITTTVSAEYGEQEARDKFKQWLRDGWFSENHIKVLAAGETQ